jgi:hypothetical protein
LLPEIATVVPVPPEVGEKLAIVGALTTVNVPGAVAVPARFVTWIEPVDPPRGTVVRISLDETTVTVD